MPLFSMTYNNGAYNMLALKIRAIQENTDKANHNLGEALATEIKNTILSQKENWPPLSERRIKEKGHNKALIDTFQLVNSVKAKYSGNTVEVGVHRDAPNKRGAIAAVHEWGDPAHSVPARPFVYSTWARTKEKLLNEWKKTI